MRTHLDWQCQQNFTHLIAFALLSTQDPSLGKEETAQGGYPWVQGGSRQRTKGQPRRLDPRPQALLFTLFLKGKGWLCDPSRQLPGMLPAPFERCEASPRMISWRVSRQGNTPGILQVEPAAIRHQLIVNCLPHVVLDHLSLQTTGQGARRDETRAVTPVVGSTGRAHGLRANLPFFARSRVSV